jgi:hypothetical protein
LLEAYKSRDAEMISFPKEHNLLARRRNTGKKGRLAPALRY